jgi:ElaA protein
MSAFHCQPMSGLSVQQLYQMLQLRSEVFVVEQACAYQDADGLDQQAWHLWQENSSGDITAYARILPPGTESAEAASIGRVVVALKHRGEQLGEHLMQAAISQCEQHWPSAPILISAQTYLSRFYQRLGFVNTGDYYLEDLIPHQKMLYQPNGD